MQTIYQIKEQAVTDTPLLLFVCELPGGRVERWSTHRALVDGQTYEARVLRHNLFEIQTASDQGVDAIPKVSLALANADSHFSEVERSVGFKGAKITAQFLFYDLRAKAPASDCRVLFQGIANPPDEITESVFRLSATNRMSMQRVLLPEVRIQRRCPWEFPSTGAQREEAVDGGAKGKYSRFYRCGYSADVEGGVGNLIGGVPYSSCGYTRVECEARGMFREDSAGRPTRRFGGIEYVPSSILVRSYGEKGTHYSAVSDNAARYNDFVPLIYGTAWTSPLVVFARNDGNLTHMEVLLGMGEIEGVLKVLVNDIEIPLGRSGANMTGTGWYNIASVGHRNGEFNLDFTDPQGRPQGDPYGSMAYLSVVVPNRINDGRALPTVKTLIQGLKVPRYDTEGSFQGEYFTNNPAWVLLDILRRGGWKLEEIDLPSFAEAAAYCDELIETQDIYGNTILTPRFQCNLALSSRRSAGDLIRGIRNGSRLFLTYGAGGLLQLRVENTLALQQPVKPVWSNSTEPLDGGWPSYEFGDGTSEFSGIRRKDNGEPSLRVWARSTADTPNRFAVEFQDAFNEYQQDSLSLVDVDDVARTGQEITASLSALGIPNYDQGARIVKFNLDRSIEGNCYVELETSVRAIGLRPGDLISLTYLKEGFNRQAFRVLKIAPSTNYRTALITAQIHKDKWYSDTNGQVPGNSQGRRQPDCGIGLPRPLVGKVLNEYGDADFEIQETLHEDTDGGVSIELSVGFVTPTKSSGGGPGIPLVSLSPSVHSTGGTLPGDTTFYYAVSAAGAEGEESALSFVVRATIPPGAATNSVTLQGISLPPAATGFHVYRGPNPSQLFRIASDQPPSGEFTDAGRAQELIAPPDPNYDHANFYWRLELQPEYSATLHSPNSVGNSALTMPLNSYRDRIVRITRGKGRGQERTVIANTGTTLTVAPRWDVEPDATSQFVVADAAWQFGAMSSSSPVQFQIPNRTGAVVHVSGRAANVNNLEASFELSPLTRWQVGGGSADAGVPPAPVFGIDAPGNGTIELAGVGFQEFTNTRNITAGTLTLHYWDELGGDCRAMLSADLGVSDESLSLTTAGTGHPGEFIQVESEVMRIDAVTEDGTQYVVSRGMHGSTASSHAAGARVYHLLRKVAIAPFVRGFFGSPWSGNWAYSVQLPDARVASAEFWVTNTQGNSETSALAFTQTADEGLRTLSGGQLSMQVEGLLAIHSGATPDLVIEASHSVRDVYAVVRQPSTGAPIVLELKQDGSPYCTLSIPEGATISSSVDGFSLPPLREGARLSLDITSVGQSNPGGDLTVIVRL